MRLPQLSVEPWAFPPLCSRFSRTTNFVVTFNAETGRTTVFLSNSNLSRALGVFGVDNTHGPAIYFPPPGPNALRSSRPYGPLFRGFYRVGVHLIKVLACARTGIRHRLGGSSHCTLLFVASDNKVIKEYQSTSESTTYVVIAMVLFLALDEKRKKPFTPIQSLNPGPLPLIPVCALLILQ